MSQTQSELKEPPTDAISAVQFARNTSRLLVASWDKHVYLYDLDGSNGSLVNKHEHRAPVMDATFGENDDVAYSAGLDWDVRKINLLTGDQTVLSSHGAGARVVTFSPPHNILISASWDLTLHVHHLATSPPTVTTIVLPNKPFSMSATESKLVVAMASRALHIYDLATLASQAGSPPEPWQRRESSLKFMTRAVSCMPTDAGYASSSIEGRVAVEWFDPSSESQARKYAFKCHRQASPEGIDIVFPVNALAFHPIHGTFASGGGDGIVALWDGVAKRRIRQYPRYQTSVAALSFSKDGKYLAIGISPGFEDGKEGAGGDGQVSVFIRELGDGEAKGKGAK